VAHSVCSKPRLAPVFLAPLVVYLALRGGMWCCSAEAGWSPAEVVRGRVGDGERGRREDRESGRGGDGDGERGTGRRGDGKKYGRIAKI
jgi:hypothetical protein